jgi:hypothetical protein
MRLGIGVVAVSLAAGISQVLIAEVAARGESVIAVAGGQDETALEWDVDVEGGTPSVDHVTLAPVARGLQAEFTVAVDRARATVTLTTQPRADRELTSVRCLDDLWPPTEVRPAIDGSRVTFEIVPGRRYRCFAATSPITVGGQAGASAQATLTPTIPPLPRSDSPTISASVPVPGWPAVLITLIVIGGIGYMLRPVRR